MPSDGPIQSGPTYKMVVIYQNANKFQISNGFSFSDTTSLHVISLIKTCRECQHSEKHGIQKGVTTLMFDIYSGVAAQS